MSKVNAKLAAAIAMTLAAPAGIQVASAQQVAHRPLVGWKKS